MLTLAVNVAVMTVALYAVLGYLAYIQTPGRPGRVGRARRRPAAARGHRPDLRRAHDRDRGRAVLLDVLDAALAAALTFGLFIVGHFNTDLKNFDKIVDSRPGDLAGARRVSHRARFLRVRHQDRSGARAAGDAGYLTATAGYGFAYIAALLVVSVLIFARRDFK